MTTPLPHRENVQRRPSMGISVEELPPEPLQSNSLTLRPANGPNSSSPNAPSKTKKQFPSFLSLLQATHRYSSYALTGFLGLHALNTCVIPLLTAFSNQSDALTAIDNGFMITRYFYRPSDAVEAAIIFAPLSLHVYSGLILRLRRIFMDRDLYGEGILAWHARQTRINRANGLSWPRIRALPTLGYSATAATGWATVLFVGLHAYTTRYVPKMYGDDGETSILIVSHALQKHPILAYGLYAGLIGFGAFHFISGWGKWLKLTSSQRSRRVKNYVVMGAVTAWLVSLLRVGRLRILSYAVKAEYDRLYRYLWGAF